MVAPLGVTLAVTGADGRYFLGAALVEAIAARLAPEALEQQLPACVTERQREERLARLKTSAATLYVCISVRISCTLIFRRD